MERFALLIFLLGFLANFSNSSVVVAPRATLQTKQWWQHANFYQIYPRSFKDSNGDGIGDIQGMISQFEHLKELGINAIWLSPIFASPQVDLGYDVSDFYEIAEEYGNMTDFEELIEKAHSLGIKILLDYIPNHTSDEHQWFLDSENKKNGKDNFYVWRNGTNMDDKIPPNNWISVFGGPAWTYSQIRKEWYLHQFSAKQPDLNYRNPEVLTEMTKVIQFYLRKNVDGFRLDAINHMFEDIDFKDEPLSGHGEPNTYDYLDHIHTKDQSETYDVVYYWRDFLEKYVKYNNLSDDCILMTEAYASTEDTMLYYQSEDGSKQGAHMPFNFALIYDFVAETNVKRIKRGIDNWLTYMPLGQTPSWVIGSHDHSRVATRFGFDRAPLANTILLTLPGTSITYYGEEIGMLDNNDFEIIVDNRDPNRTPMQWSDAENAGFSNGNSTWLPVHKNYQIINVVVDKKYDNGFQYQYKQLIELRKNPTFIHGDFNSRIINDYVIAFIRELRGYETFVVVVNLSRIKYNVDLTVVFPNLPDTLIVEFMGQLTDTYMKGSIIDKSNLSLSNYDAIILRSNASTFQTLSLGIMILSIVLRHFIKV